MKNYENIKSMSTENMAEHNVRGVTIMSGYTPTTIFFTSDGYEANDRDEAVEHETKWLNAEVDTEI